MILKEKKNPKILCEISTVTAVGMGHKDDAYSVLEIKRPQLSGPGIVTPEKHHHDQS